MKAGSKVILDIFEHSLCQTKYSDELIRLKCSYIIEKRIFTKYTNNSKSTRCNDSRNLFLNITNLV